MQPNFIFMHSHNTGRFVQPYGHAVPTPNLQRMATNGCLFHNAFSAAPTCSPSRGSFLSGMHPHCCGLLGLGHRGFGFYEPRHHIGKFLQEHGYETVLAGIDHTAAFQWGYADPVGHSKVLTPDSDRSAATLGPVVADYLRSRPEKPFFIALGTEETHGPYPAPRPDQYPEQDSRYCRPPRPFPNTPRLREMTAAFKQSARQMDECWGQILDALAETGLDRSTYVFCFTDHGLQWPLHIANLGEHGNAVYFAAQGPDLFTGGRAVDAMVSLMDLAPTVYELAGIEQPDWVQGRSLLPLMRGEMECLHERLFFEQTYHAAYEPARAVRTDRHIYIRRFDERDELVLPNVDDSLAKEDLLAHGWLEQPRHQEMLYDVYFDPDMRNNLIDSPQHAGILGELKQALADWMTETRDPLLDGPVPLPKGAMATDPDLFSPNDKPFIVGE